ncbi:hypothetical protein C1646_664371 [Rhizophagus diaphanus]|nr:hypothetical protein C1646_664371 [Rhizophagus diaphanus] [Rhizophagus sp. MUCL 43196]
MALNSYFEGSSIALKMTGGYENLTGIPIQSCAASSQNNWIYKIGQHCFIKKFLERTSKVFFEVLLIFLTKHLLTFSFFYCCKFTGFWKASLDGTSKSVTSQRYQLRTLGIVYKFLGTY